MTSSRWSFYGRASELHQLAEILGRERWFFAKVSGRRRIGKTTLIQRALPDQGQPVLYVQIPDSAPAGVLSAFTDALDTFGVPTETLSPPTSLRALARAVGALARHGYVVALDEFQYFDRKHLSEFPSHLQEVVDGLSAESDRVHGGLIVLGSLHTEMMALLEDRRAPLYSRTTDALELGHLDIASVLAILRAHADDAPERLLFFWNLFEGVPKFYRDCFERQVLNGTRHEVIERMFFQSSSPLRHEADNWFLNELRGRYDVVLKYVARHPGCTNGDLRAHVSSVSPDSSEQVGGYVKILSERFRMLERKLPIFAKPTAKRGRYYICDNYLRSWLAALQQSVAAVNFRPIHELISRADARLVEAEGHGLERLSKHLYAERSRKGLGGFRLTRQIEGYWDGGRTEIDLVALDEDEHIIRFGTCKRSASRLAGDLADFDGHIARFLESHRVYRDWRIEKVAIAPLIDTGTRRAIERRGVVPQDLNDLCEGL